MSPRKRAAAGAGKARQAPARGVAAKPAKPARPAKRAAPRRGRPALSVVRGAEHATHGRAPRPVGCAIVTVSDTRRGHDDRSGALACEMLERAGHEIVRRAWVRDEVAAIRRATRALLRLDAVDFVLVTGGTGMAARDVTPEALAPLFKRELPGFGEAFRARSAVQVGAAAWFSRATAGVARGRLVVLLPGSTAAVELALRELLVPELVHAVRLLGRFETGD